MYIIYIIVQCVPSLTKAWQNTHKQQTHQGAELQCLLKVKEDLSYVLIFQDAKNNVLNSLN